jgi:tape measure domain-containing protein
MADDRKVVYEIEIDDTGAVKGFSKFEKQANKAGKKSGAAMGGGFKTTFGAVFAAQLATDALKGLVRGFVNTAKAAVQTAIKFETLETQFKILLKSSGAAQRQMEQLSDFAARTPFQLEGIAQASKQLLAFGFTQEQSVEHLNALGDAAAASGADLRDLAQIFGQVRGATKLTGERLNQLQEKAIPISAALAKTMKIPEKAVRDMVSSGKVSFEIFEKAFKSLSDKGGLFFEGMKKRSETLEGRISTFKDNVTLSLAKIGKAIGPILKTIITKLTTWIQKNQELLDQFAKNLIPMFFTFANAAAAFVVGPIEQIISALALLNKMAAATDAVLDFLSGGRGSGKRLQAVLEGITDAAAKLGDTPVADKMADQIAQLKLEAELLAEKAKQSGKEIEDANGKAGASAVLATEKIRLSWENLTWENFTESMKKVAKDTKFFMVQVAKTIQNTMAQGVGGAFASFGKALASGEDAMGAFLNSMVSMLGQMAIQVGTMFIAQGFAYMWAGMPNGGPLIAAGAALATLGGVMSALGGGGQASGGGEFAGATSAADNGALAEPEDAEERVAGQVVNVNVQGNILDRRESGLEIAEILKESFEQDGTTVVGVNA